MANDIELKVRIGAELAEVKNALRDLRGDLNKAGKTGEQAGKRAAKGTNTLQKSINRATTALTGFFTIYTGIQALKGIVRIADEFQQINARLKLVTDSTEDYRSAQQRLFEISQDTRQELGGTIDLYARIARSTKTLNVSQEELLQVTETINKAVQLSGASGESANAALIQLGQGLASGTLRGEELNSVLEQTPRLAQAIAEGLGVTTGELRKLGADGKITGEQVLNALLQQADTINSEFGQLPRTVGQSLTQLRNEFTLAIGQADVSPLIDAVDDLRDTLSDPAVQEALIDLAAALVTITGLVAEAAAEFADLGSAIGASLASVTGQLSPLDEIELKIKEVEDALNSSVLGKPIKFLFTDPEELEKLRDQLVAEKQAIEATLGLGGGSQGESDEDRVQRLKEQAEARQRAAQAAAEQAAEEALVAKQAEQDQKKIEAMIATLREQADTYGQTNEEIVRYRLQLLGATEAEIERGAALARQVDELKRREEAEKDAAKAAEERLKAEQDLAEDLADVEIRLLEATGQNVEAQQARIAAQLDPIIEEAGRIGDEAGVALAQGLKDQLLTNLQLDDVEARIKDELDRVARAEESTENRIASGDITGPEARQELQGVRGEAIDNLQAYRAELQLLVQQDVPGAREALAQLDASIGQVASQNLTGFDRGVQQLRASVADLEEGFASTALNNFADQFGDTIGDIVTGAQSGSDAIRSLGRNFAQTLAQMAADLLARKAILAAIGAFTGGGGTAAALVAHTGAVVGRGGVRRTVGAETFAFAPRYHSGGIAGLKPGEVPAILQTGEEVLTREDPRNSLNGQQQGGGGSTRVVNVIDPALVQDYLSTADGERVIMNVIQRNKGAVKQSIS